MINKRQSNIFWFTIGCNKRRQMLKSKEFPYLFTILVSLIGWTVNHISDQLLSSKILSYKQMFYNARYGGLHSNYKGKEFNIMDCTITNLTYDYLFKNINLTVELSKGVNSDKIYMKSLQAVEPLVFKESSEDTVVAKKTHFIIEGLHPRTSAKLRVYYRGKCKPKLLLEYSSKGGRNTSKAILLMEAGIKTNILKYEIYIFSSLLIVWLILIGYYFYSYPNLSK